MQEEAWRWRWRWSSCMDGFPCCGLWSSSENKKIPPEEKPLRPAARPLSSAPIILKIRAMCSQVRGGTKQPKNHRKRDNLPARASLQRRHGERAAQAQRLVLPPALPFGPCCPGSAPRVLASRHDKRRRPGCAKAAARGQSESQSGMQRAVQRTYKALARSKGRRPKRNLWLALLASLAASPAGRLAIANGNACRAARAAARCALCRGCEPTTTGPGVLAVAAFDWDLFPTSCHATIQIFLGCTCVVVELVHGNNGMALSFNCQRAKDKQGDACCIWAMASRKRVQKIRASDAKTRHCCWVFTDDAAAAACPQWLCCARAGARFCETKASHVAARWKLVLAWPSSPAWGREVLVRRTTCCVARACVVFHRSSEARVKSQAIVYSEQTHHRSKYRGHACKRLSIRDTVSQRFPPARLLLSLPSSRPSTK